MTSLTLCNFFHIWANILIVNPCTKFRCDRSTNNKDNKGRHLPTKPEHVRKPSWIVLPVPVVLLFLKSISMSDDILQVIAYSSSHKLIPWFLPYFLGFFMGVSDSSLDKNTSLGVNKQKQIKFWKLKLWLLHIIWLIKHNAFFTYLVCHL